MIEVVFNDIVLHSPMEPRQLSYYGMQMIRHIPYHVLEQETGMNHEWTRLHSLH